LPGPKAAARGGRCLLLRFNAAAPLLSRRCHVCLSLYQDVPFHMGNPPISATRCWSSIGLLTWPSRCRPTRPHCATDYWPKAGKTYSGWKRGVSSAAFSGAPGQN
jgi:hypothetical protein